MNKLMPQPAPKAEQKKPDAPTGVSIEEAMQKLQAVNTFNGGILL